MSDLEEVVAEIERSKDEGVTAFRIGMFDDAIDCWKNSAKLILKGVCSGPEALASERMSHLDHQINSNLGMAYYKLKNYSTCVMYCDKALLRRKTMPRDLLEKNLYRKASAEYELCNYESCKRNAELLLTEFPENAAAKQLLRTVERDIESETKTEKAAYSQLFQKLEAENRRPS